MNIDQKDQKERRRFFGLELWRDSVSGLVATVAAAPILALIGYLLSTHATSPTPSPQPTSASQPAATTTAAAPTTSAPATTTSATTASSGCTITPSAVGEIYATPNPVGASTSVPVATYSVMKSEQVPFGGGSIQWYEISVQGRLVWMEDEPGQLDADTCGPP